MEAHHLARPQMPSVSHLNIAKNGSIVGVLSFTYTTMNTGTAPSVTPAQRHAGEDRPLLGARQALYQEARRRNPARYRRNPRLEPRGRRDPQSGAGKRGSDGPGQGQAFRFGWPACLPVPA